MPKEAGKDLIQINSLVTTAIARYSAFAEDLDTVLCFMVFQDTRDPPTVTKYPINDLLVRRHAPQSESQKADTVKSKLALSNNP